MADYAEVVGQIASNSTKIELLEHQVSELLSKRGEFAARMNKLEKECAIVRTHNTRVSEESSRYWAIAADGRQRERKMATLVEDTAALIRAEAAKGDRVATAAGGPSQPTSQP